LVLQLRLPQFVWNASAYRAQCQQEYTISRPAGSYRWVSWQSWHDTLGQCAMFGRHGYKKTKPDKTIKTRHSTLFLQLQPFRVVSPIASIEPWLPDSRSWAERCPCRLVVDLATLVAARTRRATLPCSAGQSRLLTVSDLLRLLQPFPNHPQCTLLPLLRLPL
jgi:hypothetical protein